MERDVTGSVAGDAKGKEPAYGVVIIDLAQGGALAGSAAVPV